jgi:hypothetical protein
MASRRNGDGRVWCPIVRDAEDQLMTRTRRRFGLFVVIAVQLFAISCSRRDPFEKYVKNVPGRFKVNGRGYILSDKEPGVIDDEAIVYTADAGARTFRFATLEVFRHLYVGHWETFDSLRPDERREAGEIARGAVAYINGLERRQDRLSMVNRLHRDLLKSYLAITSSSHSR